MSDDLPGVRPVRGAPGAARGGARPGRRQDRAPRRRRRPHLRVPLGRVRGAGQGGLSGRAHPRGLWRRRCRRDRHRHRHRGGGPRLRLVVADPRGEQAGHGTADDRRVRGRQGQVPGAGRARRGDVLLRAVRAGVRLGRGGHEDQGGAHRLRLRAERGEALDHQRRGVEVLHGDGGHRPVGGRERDLRVRAGGRGPGLYLRGARVQARHQGLADQGALLRRLRDPGRPAGRRRGRGVQDRPAARWTTPASRSRRRPWASRRARSTTRWATSGSASSSASRSPTSRACSS